MDDKLRKTNGYRWQFRLSTLLLLMLVVAVASAWWYDRGRLLRHFEAERLELGEKIRRMHQQQIILEEHIYTIAPDGNRVGGAEERTRRTERNKNTW